MRRILAVAASIFLAVAATGCEEQEAGSLTDPGVTQGPEISSAQHGNGGLVKEDPAPLVALFGPSIDGTVTLTRNLRNESLNWLLKASGLPEGHAYTIWVGNWTDGPDPLTDGGWGSGGIVGGSGRVTAAGNDCVWDLVTEWDGGFRPGTEANCDRIDVEGQVFFFLLDHGEWEPGMMLERWDPDGNPETDGDCTPEDKCDVQAAWGAFFLPLD